MSESKIEKITCPCGTVFEWEHTTSDEGFSASFIESYRPTLCNICQDARDEARDIERARLQAVEDEEKLTAAIEQTSANLDNRTPARFRTTAIAHSGFNLELWNRVKLWRPTADVPWLGLIGESGTCKTRIAYLLLREIVLGSIMPSDRRYLAFEIATAYELSEAVRNQYSKRMPDVRSCWDDRTCGEVSRDRLDRMATTGILLLDDFGKAKHTPAVAAELFAIVDHRHEENLPMIWTANSQPDALVGDMTADMAGPLCGRLIECSAIITV